MAAFIREIHRGLQTGVSTDDAEPESDWPERLETGLLGGTGEGVDGGAGKLPARVQNVTAVCENLVNSQIFCERVMRCAQKGNQPATIVLALPFELALPCYSASERSRESAMAKKQRKATTKVPSTQSFPSDTC